MRKILPVVFLYVFVCFAIETVSFSNGVVAVVLDAASGKFTMGDLERGGTALIKGFPDTPAYTRFCVRYNGTPICNDSVPGVEFFTLRDSADITDNVLSIEFNLRGNRMWEKFYNDPDIDSLDGFFFIEYTYYHDIIDSALVGISYFADIQIGNNTNPIILIPGESVLFERRFVGSDVPVYWKFFETAADTSSALGMGVSFGRPELCPDFLVFSDLALIQNTTWEHTGVGRPISDLAVFMRWEEQWMQRYDFYIVSHLYGKGYPYAGINESRKVLPTHMILGAPYPNPTNGGTSIKVNVLTGAQDIDVDVYDIHGKFVKNLHTGTLEVDEHYFRWNLEDEYGAPVPSGVYLFRVSTGRGTYSRQVMVVR